MSLGLASPTDTVCQAECADCGWTHSRALDDGEVISEPSPKNQPMDIEETDATTLSDFAGA